MCEKHLKKVSHLNIIHASIKDLKAFLLSVSVLDCITGKHTYSRGGVILLLNRIWKTEKFTQVKSL